MQTPFTFQPISSEDFPLLLTWLARPHVKEWWNDGDDTLEKVALRFGDMCGRSPDERGFLVCNQETQKNASPTPIGYVQYYKEEDRTIGIDVFIGEERFLNRGIGTGLMQAFLECLVAWFDPPGFVIDPEPENARAIRCYEKAGFQHYETVPTKEGKFAYMMRIDRRAEGVE